MRSMIEGRKGLLIAFEGLDGSGKSTQMELLARDLASTGQEVHAYRLNNNPLFKALCKVLNQADLIGPREAALMKTAEMAGRIEYAVKPLLAKGAVVLWDKYLAGTVVADLARGVS